MKRGRTARAVGMKSRRGQLTRWAGRPIRRLENVRSQTRTLGATWVTITVPVLLVCVALVGQLGYRPGTGLAGATLRASLFWSYTEQARLG